MTGKKQWKIRQHKPFYKLWYFYLIFFGVLLITSFFNLFFRGATFNNPLIAALSGLLISFFVAFFVSMAIHLIADASSGNKKFKK